MSNLALERLICGGLAAVASGVVVAGVINGDEGKRVIGGLGLMLLVLYAVNERKGLVPWRPSRFLTPRTTVSMTRNDIVFVSVFSAAGSVPLLGGISVVVRSLVSGDSVFGAVLAIGVGACFVGVAVQKLVRFRSLRRRWARLETRGFRVCATYVGAVLNYDDEEGYRRERQDDDWSLVARWQDPRSGAVHEFVSRPIRRDPRPFVHASTIDVLVDPHDPSEYLVDLDPLLLALREASRA